VGEQHEYAACFDPEDYARMNGQELPFATFVREQHEGKRLIWLNNLRNRPLLLSLIEVARSLFSPPGPSIEYMCLEIGKMRGDGNGIIERRKGLDNEGERPGSR